MTEDSSHRQIFRSSAIIGSASVLNIAIGIFKVKVLALLLGPAGVGLMGLYQNTLGMASTLAGCGMASSGVRQLAASKGEEATLSIVRRTLWLANLVFGFSGMVILWILREPVALWIFGDTAHVSDVGWLGLGVLLTLMAGSQTALLRGLRRIGDLARVTVISAFISASVGIILVYLLGQAGVLWFVLSAPTISVLVASYYAARLPRPLSVDDWQAISRQWQAMLKLGIPFMVAGLLTSATQLTVRSIILQEIGIDASGFFQAAWAISMTYIGFVLSAMSADYYPRLTGVINDHPRARKMVSEQTEMALLLAGPVLLGMITLAPWVIHLLYTANFTPASEVLRWQVLGDTLKIASWPMGFILLAKGRGGLFIGTECTWNVVYLVAVYLGIQSWGLASVGIGFWFAYLIYFAVLIGVSRSLIAYKHNARTWVYMLYLLFVGGLVLHLEKKEPGSAYLLGLLATVATGYYSLKRLDSLIDIRAWLQQRYDKWS